MPPRSSLLARSFILSSFLLHLRCTVASASNWHLWDHFCMCLHTHTQPLDQALICQRCCPAPSPACRCWCWCLLHAMRAERCAVRGACARGVDRPAGPRYLLQARVSKSEHHAPCPSRARPCHQNATTNKPGTKSHAWVSKRGAARHLWVGSTFPRCTVWQAASTGGVPAKCSVQPTLPCAPTTCFHPNLPVSETPKLSLPFGHLTLTSHSTK